MKIIPKCSPNKGLVYESMNECLFPHKQFVHICMYKSKCFVFRLEMGKVEIIYVVNNVPILVNTCNTTSILFYLTSYECKNIILR